MAKPIVISILADASGVGRGTRQAEGFLGRLGRRAGQAAKVVGVAAAGAVVAVGVSAVGAASEAEQSIGATEKIYGRYADSVIEKSEQAAQAVGLSANEYRELSNGLGAMLKNAGTPMDELAGKTDRLVGLGADLAATFGGTTSEAVAAVSSLMRGEADPIERYGVSIKQSDVNARLAAQGLTGLTGAQLKQAEATARLSLLYEQTADAQGQFRREASTFAGQQQRLTAQWEDAKATLGGRLLPVLTRVLGYLNENGPAAFAALDAAAGAVGPVLVGVAGVLGDVAGVLGSVAGYARENALVIGVLAGGYAAYRGVTAAVAAAEWALYLWQSRSVIVGAAKIAVTNGLRAAQLGLNAAMRANPIGLVVTALTLLVAGAVWAYKNVDWFRAGVQSAWAHVSKAARVLWGGIKWAFDKIVAGVRAAAGLVRGYVRLYVGAFNLVVTGARAAYTGVASWFGRVADKVRGIKTTITGVFRGAASWLGGVGEDIMRGLRAGIDRGFQWVRSRLEGVGRLIPGWLKKVLGISSPAKKVIPVGFWTAAGVGEGFKQGTRRRILPALAATATTIAAYTMPAPAAAIDWTAGSGGGRGAGGGVHIELTVNVPPTADKGAVGREVIAALRAAYREGAARP